MTDGTRGGSPGRVLLIEDDPVAAHFAMHVLGKRGGLDVRHTLDPAVALRLAGSQDWDLVLTDAELPGMSGLELLTALRRLSPALPVAVITAHESLDPAMRALRDEADEFLQKPVPPDRFLATVTALVAKGRAARRAAGLAVLAIGAHRGDAEIGAAGALLVHRALGHEIAILALARGGCGDDAVQPDPPAGESEMAALVLGATLFQPEPPAAAIADGEPAVSAIDRAVRAVRPAVVYTHSLHDVLQEHRNAHRAALMACRDAGSVYCFQSPPGTADFRPARFVAIDDQLERKLLAVSAFAAQRHVRECLEQGLIESTARYWSRCTDGSGAEAFEVIREPPP